MASFDIAIARSRFNFPVKLNKFLENGIVIIQSFEMHGTFKSPLKFMVVIDNQKGVSMNMLLN